MKNKYNTLTCLFGHHDYSERWTKDKTGYKVHLCKICKKSGYNSRRGVWYDYDKGGNIVHLKFDKGAEARCRYDENGNRVHVKWNDGFEIWYDYNEEGLCMYKKFNKEFSGGKEFWRSNYGNWVKHKPKNWKPIKKPGADADNGSEIF